MRIAISGGIGSGKSTVARLLAERTGYEYVSGGVFFRQKARELGMTIEEFNEYAESHPEIDMELDSDLLSFLRRSDDFVIESRLVGWLCYRNGIDALKIFLEASRETRARRLASRERQSYQEAFSDLVRREESELRRYRHLYGIDYMDSSFYDLVIDTENLSPEEVVNEVFSRLSKGYRC
ncbi:cytidylate kinase [Thermogymnomonas acidicola]|uniref:Cytidylate kinase n=1 Tax=Thermogymnomonas acidicola TaxID=399579 RepID=A0AA37BQZ5_9ARCH|nr:AAA family ATPase [Thermogymnomonas acidicola]GGM72110.1 cytidylate kinase [Thermogymnomonas acidicola]